MQFEQCKAFGESFRIRGLSTATDLTESIRHLSKQTSHFKYLVTLDDFGQASYTSMHAITSNNIDGGSWLLDEVIPDSWLDGDYPVDDLSFEQQLVVRKLGFKHGLKNKSFEDIFNKNLYLNDTTRDELVAANSNILSIIDTETYLIKTSLQHHYELIYAFPNGYFSCDLSPFENYYLAKYLEDNFGLHLFGIGTSYITFIKSDRFKSENIGDLLSLLSRLYTDGEDLALMEFFQNSILCNDLLTLRYTE